MALFWLGLTLWAEWGGAEQRLELKAQPKAPELLVAYNPDPFYDLDAQICEALAKALHAQGFTVTLATAGILEEKDHQHDLLICCANTYSFSPDFGIQSAVEDLVGEKAKEAIAITLRVGSTTCAQRRFQQFLGAKGLNLLLSKAYWLMRPNDERRMSEVNTEVAIKLAVKEVGQAVQTWHASDH